MEIREQAKNKAKELLKKVDEAVSGDISEHGSKYMVELIIDEILQTNPTIKGNSEDLITMIVQSKAYWYLVKEELNKL
jgi:hypothetical protein